jgi:hypothetical protein
MRKGRNGAARWDVYDLRRRVARLGTVSAGDRGKALRKAIKQFDIPMQDRIRVAIEKATQAVASLASGLAEPRQNIARRDQASRLGSDNRRHDNRTRHGLLRETLRFATRYSLEIANPLTLISQRSQSASALRSWICVCEPHTS